jgi:hypothetical protein
LIEPGDAGGEFVHIGFPEHHCSGLVQLADGHSIAHGHTITVEV